MASVDFVVPEEELLIGSNSARSAQSSSRSTPIHQGQEERANLTKRLILVKGPGANNGLGFSTPDHLVLISTPPGIDRAIMGGNFIYDDSAGFGQTIYVVDSGAMLNLAVSTMQYLTIFSSLYLELMSSIIGFRPAPPDTRRFRVSRFTS